MSLDELFRSKAEQWELAGELWKHLQANVQELGREAVLAEFRSLCEQFEHAFADQPRGGSSASNHAAQQQWNRLRRELGPHVDSTLDRLVRRNLKEADFYSFVWDYLTGEFPFTDESERSFALFWILIDKRIPYFHLPPEQGVEMSNEDYEALGKKLREPLGRIRFMQSCGLRQRTQVASHILSVLDQYNGLDRVVLMAHAIVFPQAPQVPSQLSAAIVAGLLQKMPREQEVTSERPGEQSPLPPPET